MSIFLGNNEISLPGIASVSLGNQTIWSGGGPKKGQLITMNLGNSTPTCGTNNLYRILSLNGNIATVMAMYHIGYYYYNQYGLASYANQPMDIALNTTFYNSLSSQAKSAIIETNIVSYYYTSSTSQYNASTHASTVNLATTPSPFESLTRYIYPLDPWTIEIYFNYIFSESDLSNFLWNSSTVPDAAKPIWLLGYGGTSYGTAQGWKMFYIETAKKIQTSALYNEGDARPCFTIDLSKISWS